MTRDFVPWSELTGRTPQPLSEPSGPREWVKDERGIVHVLSDDEDDLVARCGLRLDDVEELSDFQRSVAEAGTLQNLCETCRREAF
jgi:hypothetical protein